MSDSDEDFASADEGDTKTKHLDTSEDVSNQAEKVEKLSIDSTKVTADSKAVLLPKRKDKSKQNEKKKVAGSVKGCESNQGLHENPQGRVGKGKSQNTVAKEPEEKSSSGGNIQKGKHKSNTSKKQSQVKNDSMSNEDEHTQFKSEKTKLKEEAPGYFENDSTTGIQSESPENVVDLKETIIVETASELKTSTDQNSDITADIQTPSNVDAKVVSLQSLRPDDKSGLQPVKEASLLKSPSSQSISRPPLDHTEKQEAVLERLVEGAKEKKAGWGWSWGSSLLEAAASSVTTFTHNVGEGFNTMLETVESTLNVPNPEELAKTSSVKHEDNEDNSQTSEPAKDNDKEIPASSSMEQQEDKSAIDNTGFKDSENQSSIDNTELKDSENQSSESLRSSSDMTKQSSDSWFSAWGMSNITKIVENTSKSLVTGGLDVLESIGKKTFDVINEQDPGLKKTTGLFLDRGDKPNLSAILRDAKEQQEIKAQQELDCEEARKCHFGSQFDDFQGLSHLKALEMLSNQSEKHVNMLLNALSSDAISSIKPLLLQIKKNFEVAEEDEDEDEAEKEGDFNQIIIDLLQNICQGLTAGKLIQVRGNIHEHIEQWKNNSDNKPATKVVHETAIKSLAEFTSKSMEQFHKAGELILINNRNISDFVVCSSLLHRLTKVLCAQVNMLSSMFTEYLSELSDGGDSIRTNIFFEATNSSSYIHDGFQLLLPVLQQAAIEKGCEPVD